MSDDTKLIPSSDDPLGINKLAVDYDYLMYKIDDYVQSIQLQTHSICMQHDKVIKEEIIEGIIDKNIAEFKALLESCNELENYFDMLEQISFISDTFRQRLDGICNELKTLKRGKVQRQDLRP
ncbi:Cyclin cln1 [Maudiozyma exigua]|uniref:Biogenesis of lysosome-related organelles complex 1 subunit CNL1 n=1 Tax=Maudiozyma exigua TaxID=34358 RepID=A0A9P6W787_MAUEX|nr:Cyclin cln1 [Kazachstania exigua]